MSEESVIALGEKFQQLRNRPGKYDGAEYDENVDSFEGEKYKVMKVSFLFYTRQCYQLYVWHLYTLSRA